MSPLEKLFRLEIEFHRRLRTAAPGLIDAGSLHTSYALQTGYELLLSTLRLADAADIEEIRERLLPTADSRDLLAACDSVTQLLDLFQHHRQGRLP